MAFPHQALLTAQETLSGDAHLIVEGNVATNGLTMGRWLAALLAGTAVLSCGKSEEPIAASPSRSSIGPEGGTIVSSDGNLVLTIPPGGLHVRVELSIEPAVSPMGGIGRAYEIQPSGLLFDKPALMQVGYTAAELGAHTIAGLHVATYVSGRWEGSPTIVNDPTAHNLTAGVPHLSLWGLSAEDAGDVGIDGSISDGAVDGDTAADSCTAGSLALDRGGTGPVTLIAGLATAHALVADADALYLASYELLLRVPKTGGATTTIATGPAFSIRELAVDDRYLYWQTRAIADPDDHMRVVRASLPCGTPRAILERPIRFAGSPMAARGGLVCLSFDLSPGVVSCYPRDGGAEQPVDVAQPIVENIGAGPSFFYAASRGDFDLILTVVRFPGTVGSSEILDSAKAAIGGNLIVAGGALLNGPRRLPLSPLGCPCDRGVTLAPGTPAGTAADDTYLSGPTPLRGPSRACPSRAARARYWRSVK